jgi:glycosyltransferase involved in cell wall biosynthesis
MPKVSIIIPTYCRAHIISETLESVIAQTYTNWECIVVDDGSNDHTVEVVGDYLKKDSRFKYYVRPVERIKGASTCRNIGLENAVGEFIQFLDSDDLISSNKLAEQIKLLKDCPENVIATCKWGRFKSNINDSTIFENLKTYDNFQDMLCFLDALAVSKGYFPPNSYLIKTSIIKKVGLWNEHLSINDDGEFMMRIISNTDKIYFASNAIAYYRWTESSNLSNFNNIQKVDDAINSWKLVDAYLKIRFKKDSITYVDKVKNAVYINVKNSFPELTLKHSDFFKNQLEELQVWRRVIAKIKQILSKL